MGLGELASRVRALSDNPAFAALKPSIANYYGDDAQLNAMDAFYRRFLARNALAFDIGAHVGDRTACFRRLGARVVSVEPQPICASALKLLFDADPDVTVVAKACAAVPGEVQLHVNSVNPTVTTASAKFMQNAAGASGWEGQQWDATVSVPATTLAELIAAFGQPDFIKVDVEGFEDEALASLTEQSAPPALSFEFTTIERSAAQRALKQVDALGGYAYDFSLGESRKLNFGKRNEVDAATLSNLLDSLPHEANSGDIYAIRTRS